MSFIEDIKARAKADKKTVVLPEAMDVRILKATEIVLKEELSHIVLLRRCRRNKAKSRDRTNLDKRC